MSYDYLSTWAADVITPAALHILCFALRYNKPNKSKNHKSILFIKGQLKWKIHFMFYHVDMLV